MLVVVHSPFLVVAPMLLSRLFTASLGQLQQQQQQLIPYFTRHGSLSESSRTQKRLMPSVAAQSAMHQQLLPRKGV